VAGRRAATVLVNLVVAVVLAEVVAVAIYYVQHGGFFYLHRKVVKPLADVRQQGLTATALHPYFGPTHKPGHPFSVPEPLLKGAPHAAAATNNFGFVSAHDYPYGRKSEAEFLVGIFGGSVGVWFCQLGAERLREDLARDPRFRGRDVVPLCFSHEGYKQPQQALVLAYFLSIGQQFDLVVNIDGFNEVALGSLNDQHGLDISMPSVMHIDPLVNLVNQATLTPEKLASLAAIGRHRQRLNALAERINRNRIASVNFVLEQYYRMVANRLVSEQFRFAALPSSPSGASLVYVTPKTKERVGAALFEDIARNWAAASTLMHQMLAARSVPYVHVLQPNQYYTRRTFGAAEATVAINDRSPFKPGVERGYPILRRLTTAPQWRHAGVRFLDATAIFDREPSAVYVDDCCHYTVEGNRILADYVASGILAAAPAGRAPTAAGTPR
jgi:hypothetical protein